MPELSPMIELDICLIAARRAALGADWEGAAILVANAGDLILECEKVDSTTPVEGASVYPDGYADDVR